MLVKEVRQLGLVALRKIRQIPARFTSGMTYYRTSLEMDQGICLIGGGDELNYFEELGSRRALGTNYRSKFFIAAGLPANKPVPRDIHQMVEPGAVDYSEWVVLGWWSRFEFTEDEIGSMIINELPLVKKPSRRQAMVLAFIRDHQRNHGYPPTHREIAAHMGIGSTNAVADHLRALQRKGWLERTPDKSRALRVVDPNPVIEMEPLPAHTRLPADPEDEHPVHVWSWDKPPPLAI